MAMTKRKLLFFVVLIVLGIVIMQRVFSSNDETAARNITQKYFDAVKAGDTEGAIKCFTPAIQQQYNSALSLGGIIGQLFTGIDASSLLGGIVSAANQNAYKDCEFKADKVEFTDDAYEHAKVHVTVKGASGGIPSEATINVVKYDGEWYVDQ